jgi:NADH dehydrogenase/putative oxidoreductase
VKVTGATAWWLWGAVHVFFLVGVRNRLSVMFGWIWSYFTFDVGVRLITEQERINPHRYTRAKLDGQPPGDL